LAADLAEIDGSARAADRRAVSLAPIILRTRYFDNFLQRVTRENAIQQIALMAAGLDTCAYCLFWPAGRRVFKMDRAVVLRSKEQTLRFAGAHSNCQRQTIEVDLTRFWKEALNQAGFKPDQPSVWLLEDFLFLYLHRKNFTVAG